jgi:hypothetical protein
MAFYYYIMTTYRRHRFAWRPNELERLNREYENQELTVQQISVLHERSIRSIFFKLESEGLIDRWDQARGWSAYAQEMDYPDYSATSLDQEDEESDEDYEEDEEEDAEEEEEDEDEDEDEEEDEEYDAYSIKQKMNFLQTQINNIRKIVSGILYDSSNKTTARPSAHCYNYN